MSAFQHILVPTDFGESSTRALDLALEIAAKFDSRITVLHAGWVPTQYFAAYSEVLAMPASELAKQARKELDDAVQAAKKKHARVEAQLITGDAPERILDFAKEHGVDAIVMGTHGRRGIPRVLLGSVAEKIVRLADVPVVTVGAPRAAAVGGAGG
jgi:nucleotide-binding universal stress UspA family protein